MRTTITRIIRLLALLLIGYPAGTMAQINEHPEYYKVNEFENYSSEFGADFTFCDAQFYNGRLYAVALRTNTSVSLMVFDVNGNTIKKGSFGSTNSYRSKLNSGGIYQDAELVVFRNRLYVLWKNNTSGQIWIGEVDVEKGEYKKTRMLDDGKTYANFGATIYRDRICVVLHRRTTDKLQVYSYDDPELNSGWTWCGSVQNGTNDNIKLAGSTSITSEYTPDDHWDVETWYGKDNTTDKIGEKLIIGRVHNGNFEVFSYGGDFGTDNNWPATWDSYVSHSIGRSKTFSLKLVQAGIEGYTDNNPLSYSAASNPLLFSYCTYDGKGTGEHFLKEYYPGSRTFAGSTPIYTDLPYGYVAATTAAFPTDETLPGGGRYYKQYLYILRGNKEPYHWHDHSYIASIRSNELIENRKSFNDEKAFFTNPDLRKLVRLVGIVEGPPPTVVDNNDWFKSLGVASSLDFTMGSGTSNSVSRTFKGDLKISIGPHTDNITAQLGGGYSFRETYEEVKSSEESVTVSFRSEDVDDYRAIALYSVPIITRCDLEYLTPTGRKSIQMPTLSYIYMNDHYIKQMELPLTMKPFDIEDPARLESWQARDILTSATSENVYRKSVGFSLNTPQINMRLETSGTISNSNTEGALNTIAVKAPFFELENQLEWEWTDITTTTTSQGISATFSQIRKSDPFVRPGETVESFASTLYLLTAEQSKTLENIYYPDLLKQKIKYGSDSVSLMVAEDKPFLLAWDINNITYTRGNIAVTDNEEIADEPLSIRFLDGMLTVDCLPGATVNVYSMNGTLAGHQQAVSGKAIFSLPGHLYTVEVVTERYRKIQKVAR